MNHPEGHVVAFFKREIPTLASAAYVGTWARVLFCPEFWILLELEPGDVKSEMVGWVEGGLWPLRRVEGAEIRGKH